MIAIKKIAAWTLLLFLHYVGVFAQIGTLDATFGTGGIYKLPTQMGIARYTNNALSWIQNDGKIVVMGVSGSDNSLQVTQMRLNTNGLPDSEFANGVVDLPSRNLYASLKREDDSYGVIYLQQSIGELDRIMLKWFESDGMLSSAPPVEIPLYISSGRSVVKGSGGTIYIHGTGTSNNEWGIFRLFENGIPDQTWGNGGFVPLPAESRWSEYGDLYADGANRVVFSTENYETDSVAIVRFSGVNGALDTTFSNDGIALIKGGWAPAQSFGRLLAFPDGTSIFSKLEMAAATPQLTLFRLDESGDLDETFGQNGWVHTSIPASTSTTSYSVDAIKAINTTTEGLQFWFTLEGAVEGTTDIIGSAYHADGSPDINFGNGGLKVIDLDQYEQPEGVLPGAEGTVFVISSTAKMAIVNWMYLEYNHIAVTALRSNGTFDDNYGVQGVAPVIFSKGSETYLAGFRQLPDGRIVMAGYFDDGVQKAVEITRRMPDGFADITYGDNGYIRNSLPTYGYYERGTCIWEDGSVAFLSYNPGLYISRVAKFNAVGAPDEVFAPNGQLFIEGRFDRILSAIAGSVVLYSRSGAFSTLKKFLYNGTPDMSFGSAGSVQIATSSNFIPSDLEMQQNGAIVLLGFEGTGINRATVVYRRTASGQPDVTFGINGKVTDNFSIYERSGVMAILPNGGLLITGNIDYQAVGYSDTTFLARLLPDGSRDVFFGNQGVVFTSPFERVTPVAVLLQPDGKIVLAQSVAGENGIAAGTNLHTFLPDGSVDEAFGGEEGLLLPLVNQPEWGDMFWTPDHKIIVSGFDFPSAVLQPVLARVIPDYLSDTETPSENQRNIAIFPNPCPARQSFVQLKVQLPQAGTAEIELMTSDGRVVERWPSRYFDEGEHTVQLPLLHSLSVGSYQCVWRSADKVYLIPFMVF